MIVVHEKFRGDGADVANGDFERYDVIDAKDILVISHLFFLSFKFCILDNHYQRELSKQHVCLISRSRNHRLACHVSEDGGFM